jgi:glycosyltransferase involved in cell wall biosynthesis
MLKIAMISDAAYPFSKGGVEKRNWDIALRLSARGHEIHMLNGLVPAAKSECIVDGIHIHGVRKAGDFYVSGRRSILSAVKFAFWLIPHLLRNNYDVYVCDQFPLLHILPVRAVTWLKGRKLILTWHEVWAGYWFKYLGWIGFAGYLAERLSVRLADRIISVSEQTTQALIDTLKVNPKRLETVVNGIPFDYINGVKPSEETSDLIFVGRLISHKNVDRLIGAIGVIADSQPGLLSRCLIVGDGPERQALEQMVSDKRIDVPIVFKGMVESTDELYGLMKASKVFVLPSTREGFGITVIEANACGLPVVTSGHADNAARHLVQAGRTGYISGLGETELAGNILTALHYHAAMKANCVEFSRKFDWENSIRRIESIYTETI